MNKRAMKARLERYLDRRRLEVNIEKKKVMVFRKGGERKKNRLEVERERNRGNEGDEILMVGVSGKWQTARI